VSELKAEKQRYWLTYLLDDLPIGETFGIEKLHLTVIPWFVTDKLSENRVVKSFEAKFSGLQTIQTEIGQVVEMGGRDVVVNLVQPQNNLLEIHRLSLDWFDEIDGRWAVKNPYVGEDYKPHIRRRSQTSLKPGDKLTLNNLSLIKASRTEDFVREVAAKVELK
jgi:hypothetical protein